MNCFASKPLIADGKILVYWMAGDGPHFGLRRTSLRRSSFRMDGLVAATLVDASKIGKLRTRPLRVNGRALAITYDGSIRVAIEKVEADGSTTLVHAAQECIEMSGSGTDALVAWGSGAHAAQHALAKLQGQMVVVTIELHGAGTRVYTLSFVDGAD